MKAESEKYQILPSLFSLARIQADMPTIQLAAAARA